MCASKPTISVIITSYNYANYLKDVIGSVQKQSFEDWEIVIVDDGSSDNSVEIIESMAIEDKRIRLIQHEDKANHGLISSIQLGLEKTRADIIVFLESDDELMPTSLERRYQYMCDTNAGLVFNANSLDAEEGVDTEHWLFFEKYCCLKFGDAKEPFALGITELCYNYIFTFSCVMIKKQIIMDCDFNPPNDVWIDWWLWMQLAHKPIFFYCCEPLTKWRLHKKSYNHTVVDPNKLLAIFKKEYRRKKFNKYYKSKKYEYCLILFVWPPIVHFISKFMCLSRKKSIFYAFDYYTKRIAKRIVKYIKSKQT